MITERKHRPQSEGRQASGVGEDITRLLSMSKGTKTEERLHGVTRQDDEHRQSNLQLIPEGFPELEAGMSPRTDLGLGIHRQPAYMLLPGSLSDWDSLKEWRSSTPSSLRRLAPFPNPLRLQLWP